MSLICFQTHCGPLKFACLNHWLLFILCEVAFGIELTWATITFTEDTSYKTSNRHRQSLHHSDGHPFCFNDICELRRLWKTFFHKLALEGAFDYPNYSSRINGKAAVESVKGPYSRTAYPVCEKKEHSYLDSCKTSDYNVRQNTQNVSRSHKTNAMLMVANAISALW